MSRKPYPRRCYGDALKPFVSRGAVQLAGGDDPALDRYVSQLMSSIVFPTDGRAPRSGLPHGCRAVIGDRGMTIDAIDGRRLRGPLPLTDNFARDRARLIELLWPSA